MEHLKDLSSVPSLYHKDVNEFMNLCKIKLIRTSLPIYVGNDGYVRWKQNKPIGVYQWDLDELGRLVFIIDDFWGFQRYIDRNILVYKSINDNLDDFNLLDAATRQMLIEKISLL